MTNLRRIHEESDRLRARLQAAIRQGDKVEALALVDRLHAQECLLSAEIADATPGKRYTVTIQGREHVWNLEVHGTAEHAEDWRRDGLQVDELLEEIEISDEEAEAIASGLNGAAN